MLDDQSSRDQLLRDALAAYQTTDQDYWSFRGNAAREHAHAYFQYPAMMVPQMQGNLLQAVLKAAPATRHVLDPFVGSGTVLTEAMLLGLDFSGYDINPLAILLCRAKVIPFFDSSLRDKLAVLLYRARADRSRVIEAKFPRWQKWFRQDVAISLSRIQRAIRFESALWARRFFWIALAETVRVSSNSRTSTFKLHIRPRDEQLQRTIVPLDTFAELAARNLEHLRSAKCRMKERGHLHHSRYRGIVNLHLSDATLHNNTDMLADLLITSPPYGDNTTTIPYGQHSYLPLQWTALGDVGNDVDYDCLKTTHEIDHRSLGGSRRLKASDRLELCSRSKSLAETLCNLQAEPRDRALRVASFCRDLDRTLDPTFAKLKPGAYMIWIVGNRQVGGLSLPLDRILTELLESRSAVSIGRISRAIPSKRMAVRNDIADTMGRETILVLRKG